MSNNVKTNDTVTPFICFPYTIYSCDVTEKGCNKNPSHQTCDDCCFVSLPCTIIGDFITIIPRYVKHKFC